MRPHKNEEDWKYQKQIHKIISYCVLEMEDLVESELVTEAGSPSWVGGGGGLPIFSDSWYSA